MIQQQQQQPLNTETPDRQRDEPKSGQTEAQPGDYGFLQTSPHRENDAFSNPNLQSQLEAVPLPLDLRRAVEGILDAFREQVAQQAAENAYLRNEVLRLQGVVDRLPGYATPFALHTPIGIKQRPKTQSGFLAGPLVQDALSKLWTENKALRSALHTRGHHYDPLQTSPKSPHQTAQQQQQQLFLQPERGTTTRTHPDPCRCSLLVESLLTVMNDQLARHEQDEWRSRVGAAEADRDRLSIRVAQLVNRLAELESKIRRDPFLSSAFHLAQDQDVAPKDILGQMHDAYAQLANVQSYNAELERRLEMEKAANRRWQPELRALKQEAREYAEALGVYLDRASKHPEASLTCPLARGCAQEAYFSRFRPTSGWTGASGQMGDQILREAQRKINADACRIEVLMNRVVSLEEELATHRVERYAILEHLASAPTAEELTKRLYWVAQQVEQLEVARYLNNSSRKTTERKTLRYGQRVAGLSSRVEGGLVAKIIQLKTGLDSTNIEARVTEIPPSSIPESKVFKDNSAKVFHATTTKLASGRDAYRKAVLLGRKSNALSLSLATEIVDTKDTQEGGTTKTPTAKHKELWNPEVRESEEEDALTYRQKKPLPAVPVGDYRAMSSEDLMRSHRYVPTPVDSPVAHAMKEPTRVAKEPPARVITEPPIRLPMEPPPKLPLKPPLRLPTESPRKLLAEPLGEPEVQPPVKPEVQPPVKPEVKSLKQSQRFEHSKPLSDKENVKDTIKARKEPAKEKPKVKVDAKHDSDRDKKTVRFKEGPTTERPEAPVIKVPQESSVKAPSRSAVSLPAAPGTTCKSSETFASQKAVDTKAHDVQSNRPPTRKAAGRAMSSGAWSPSMTMEERELALEARIAEEWRAEQTAAAQLRKSVAESKQHDDDQKQQILFYEEPKIHLENIGPFYLNARLFVGLDLKTQFYVGAIRKYGSLASIFFAGRGAFSPSLVDAHWTMKDFENVLRSLDIPVTDFKDTHELFNALCDTSTSTITLGSLYCALEDLKHVNLRQTYRRLAETFGNPPRNAFENVCGSSKACFASISLHDFEALASYVGLTNENARNLWSLIVLKNQKELFQDNLFKLLSGSTPMAEVYENESKRRAALEIDASTETAVAPSLAPPKLEISPSIISLAELSIKRFMELARQSERTSSVSLGSLKSPFLTTMPEPQRTVEEEEEESLQLLINAKVLLHVSEDIRSKIITDIESQHYYCGETLCYSADIPDCFYVVKRGVAALIMSCTISRQYKPGEVFGITALMKNSPTRGEEIVALSDLTVLVVSKQIYDKYLRESMRLSLGRPDNADDERNTEAQSEASEEKAEQALEVTEGPITRKLSKRKVTMPPSKLKKDSTITRLLASDDGATVAEGSKKKKKKKSGTSSKGTKKKKKDTTATVFAEHVERLRQLLQEHKTNLPKMFMAMRPDPVTGAVIFDSFAVTMEREFPSFIPDITEAHEFFTGLCKPHQDELYIADFYRNVLGSSTERMEIFRRAGELFATEAPKCKWLDLPVLNDDDDVHEELFYRLIQSLGISVEDGSIFWNEITEPSRRVVKLQHIKLYLKGVISVEELKNQEATQRSFMTQLADIFKPLQRTELPSNLSLSNSSPEEFWASLDPHVECLFEEAAPHFLDEHTQHVEETSLVEEALAQRSPWTWLHSEQRTYVVSLTRRRVCPPGNVLFSQGTKEPALYVVVCGQFEIVQTNILGFQSSSMVAEAGAILNDDDVMGHSHERTEVEDIGNIIAADARTFLHTGTASADQAPSVAWELSLRDFEDSVRPLLLERQKKVPFIIKALQATPCIQDLDIELLQRVAAAIKVERVRTKTTLTKLGRPGERFSIVLAGTVLLSEEGSAASSVTRKGPGEYIGEIALIRNRPSTVSIVAETDVKLLSLGRDAFDALIMPTDVPNKMLTRDKEYQEAQNIANPSRKAKTPTTSRSVKRRTTTMFFPDENRDTTSAGYFSLKADEDPGEAPNVKVPCWTFAPDPSVRYSPPRVLAPPPARSALRQPGDSIKEPRNVRFDTATLLPQKDDTA